MFAEFIDALKISVDPTKSLDTIREANERVNSVLEDPQCWSIYVEVFDDYQKYPKNIVVAAIQTINTTAKRYWNYLPPETIELIRNRIAVDVIKFSSDGDKDILNYLISALSMVIVREWPERWPNIVEELISKAQSESGMIYTNVRLIKHLAIDTMEMGSRFFGSTRLSKLKRAFLEKTGIILEFIIEVLNAVRDDMILAEILDCLKYMVKFTDTTSFFQYDYPRMIIEHFITQDNYRKTVLFLFGELANNEHQLPEQHVGQIAILFGSIFENLPIQTVNEDNYSENKDLFDALIFCVHGFIMNYLTGIEEHNGAGLQNGLGWIITLIPHVPLGDDIYYTCMEILERLADHYIHEIGNEPVKQDFYLDFFNRILVHLVSKVQKPPDMLLSLDEDGNISSETGDIVQCRYATVKNTMCKLASIDSESMINSVDHIIAPLKRVSGASFTPEAISSLNRSTYLLGMISEALPKKQESDMFLNVISLFIKLQQEAKNENDRAITTVNLLFVCSKYPRVLMQSSGLMKEVIKLVVASMQYMSDNEDVILKIRRASVGCFRDIISKCKSSIVQNGIISIDWLVGNIIPLIEKLENNDVEFVINFLDAITCLIPAIRNNTQKVSYFDSIVNKLRTRWDDCCRSFDLDDPDFLYKINTVLQSLRILSKNSRHLFLDGLSGFNESFCDLYKKTTQRLGKSSDMSSDHIEALIRIRRNIIKVYDHFFDSPESSGALFNKRVVDSFLSAIIDVFDQDYSLIPPKFRSPEILKVNNSFMQLVPACDVILPKLYEYLFSPTLAMCQEDIQQGTSLYSDFISFFCDLLKSVINKGYAVLMSGNEESFDLFHKAITYACKSHNSSVSAKGIDTLVFYLKKIGDYRQTSAGIRKAFYERYYKDLIQVSFSLLTDTFYIENFKNQIKLIDTLFRFNYQESKVDYIAECISEIIPNRSIDYLKSLVHEIIDKPLNKVTTLRDFVVDLQQLSPSDSNLDVVQRDDGEILSREDLRSQRNQKIPGLGNVESGE